MTASLRETVRFLMFATHDLLSAIRSYRQVNGHTPTMALIQPDFYLEGESEILLRSSRGAAGAILLTHLCNPAEWVADLPIPTLPTVTRVNRIMAYQKARAEAEVKDDKKVPQRKRGRRSRGGGTCPHCKQKISDFNELGHWYGWNEGVTPPYWQELRLYVFQRDDYTCNQCGSRRPASKLNAHHIIPKETIGTDSARNLMTLCEDCHLDPKPIMPEQAVMV